MRIIRLLESIGLDYSELSHPRSLVRAPVAVSSLLLLLE